MPTVWILSVLLGTIHGKILLPKKKEAYGMYQIIVREIGKTGILKTAPTGWCGKALAAENCRISALSSADYCLRSRVDVDWGHIAWKGSKQEIRRLFDAERLNDAGLEQLSDHKDYAVLFLGKPWMDAAWSCAG